MTRLFSTLSALFAAAALLLALAPAAPAAAQTIIRVDAGASGSGDGASWSGAYRTLQDALDLVNNNPDNDYEIWIAEGTYYPDEDNRRLPYRHLEDDPT